MPHTLEQGGMIYKFGTITNISRLITAKSNDFQYIALVDDEDRVDIWGLETKRSLNEVVYYYKVFNNREINEQDIVLLNGKDLLK